MYEPRTDGEPCTRMKIDSDYDVSYHRNRDYEFCREFHFDVPVPDFDDPVDDSNEDKYDDLAIEALERILGFRFDEDDWYMFDWRDDQTLWIRYNVPYPARRLPL